MAKALEIIKEEAEKKGIKLAEKAILDVFSILEAAAPRLALEADESAAKIVGSGLSIALPAFKSSVEKMADLDKDGKIG